MCGSNFYETDVTSILLETLGKVIKKNNTPGLLWGNVVSQIGL